MKKKVFIYSDIQGFRHGSSAIGDAIIASYATRSSYQYTPVSISGSYLPWSDSNGKPLTASWASGPSTPFTPFVTTPPKDDMQKLKESLDFLYTTKMDLEEQVDDLYAQLTDAKYHSADFLLGKDTAQMETVVLKDQIQSLANSLKEEKNRSSADINYWKLKFDASESNHKFEVNHCIDLNRTIKNAKDEVQKLRDAKGNNEELARQLFKLSCPGMYLPEVQKCGKCVSCQLEQANRVRQELADHLAATKKESEGYRQQMDSLRYEREAAQSKCATLDSAISNMETENKKLNSKLVNLSNSHYDEVKHLWAIITILARGVTHIINGGIFIRKSIAEQVKVDMTSYIANNKLDSDKIIKE